jgi:hypothetical protein
VAAGLSAACAKALTTQGCWISLEGTGSWQRLKVTERSGNPIMGAEIEIGRERTRLNFVDAVRKRLPFWAIMALSRLSHGRRLSGTGRMIWRSTCIIASHSRSALVLRTKAHVTRSRNSSVSLIPLLGEAPQ